MAPDAQYVVLILHRFWLIYMVVYLSTITDCCCEERVPLGVVSVLVFILNFSGRHYIRLHLT